jgi:hypothetical protein
MSEEKKDANDAPSADTGLVGQRRRTVIRLDDGHSDKHWPLVKGNKDKSLFDHKKDFGSAR